MELIIKGEPKEIAALVLELQERQEIAEAEKHITVDEFVDKFLVEEL